MLVIAEPSTSTVAPVALSEADAFMSIVAASSLMEALLFIFASDVPSKVEVFPSTSTSESASILIFRQQAFLSLWSGCLSCPWHLW